MLLLPSTLSMSLRCPSKKRFKKGVLMENAAAICSTVTTIRMMVATLAMTATACSHFATRTMRFLTSFIFQPPWLQKKGTRFHVPFAIMAYFLPICSATSAARSLTFFSRPSPIL